MTTARRPLTLEQLAVRWLESCASEREGSLAPDDGLCDGCALRLAHAAFTLGQQQGIAQERERCEMIADKMKLGPWGDEHEAITPKHLAEQIAAAIRAE